MATLSETMSKSVKVIDTIKNDAVRLAANRLVERCYNEGVEIRITHGTRTYAEQNALYAQGRTVKYDKKGNKLNIVTNAKAGDSYHNHDLAFDFVLIKGGYDMKADNDGDGVADWVEVVTQAKLEGLEWGGDWSSFKDYPHFQMSFGLSIKQLKAGQKPTAAQIKAAIDKINALEENPDMTKELEAKLKTQGEALEGMEKRVAAMEKRLNMSGNQNPPKWAVELIERAKRLEVIKKGNDKSQAELVGLQMLDNIGLLNPGVLALIAAAKTEEKAND